MNSVDDKAGNITDSWDFFDRFYCVSLKDREDRRRSALKEFSKVGLAGRIEFELGDHHPNNIEQGVYESHMLCLRRGLEAGARNIVIFEDDVVFDGFDPERLRSCTEFLRRNPEWKVLLLGALIRSSRKTDNPCVQKVRYQSLSHAYALNRQYAETLAYKPWQGIVNDTLFRPLTDHIYAVNPMFAFQGDLSTNNKYRALYRFRKWCGGLKHIQKANEFYLHHKFGIISAHVLMILSLVLSLISK